ncbi:uncharacterized RNA-binding protein C17H9.04c [Arachis ipaensis]|uniref:uncharacterized RNA-binding protein C17H9.04c n=1 Tax=Arachis ipaensis TaxID=130454 RepID=UPI000A2B7700|nr:uncharacterized RNA-binding protein C17H9.04c [Arachis ipaensis]
MSWSGGDWMCGACQHINFKKREACQNCGYPKFGGPDPSTYRYHRTEALAGDWFCTGMNCGAHNYASRSNCYRCGAFKDDYSSGYGGNMAGSVGYGSDCSFIAEIVNKDHANKNRKFLDDFFFLPRYSISSLFSLSYCNRIGCGVHNYASRTECFKCKMPRNFGGAD